MVTHFTLVVWATAGDASDARRSTTVHMGGSAACVKDVRKRDEEAPWWRLLFGVVIQPQEPSDF